ncbi:glycosyltransferase [Campylobacter sp. 19-13652]|uniref:glycosyltransferase n=1 Tax=Campylobacter sp. 19-13652 TaxID=2840180 RepID=UPI001C77F5B8|nr:glycosyltransferase [Campylobacter sp. 19-13652]BCX79966.1 hypothetical protein LBC_14280 [Campylobacter sp. 19-13652]
MDSFYKDLEDKFRGERNQIKNRLYFYKDILDAIKQQNHQDEIIAIDIGCGRGEWLEILKENKINGMGCDNDERMVLECSKRGLQAKKIDAIEFLKSIKDSSVDIVSGFHIAEHFQFDVLKDFLKQANRILKNDGVLILETPNAENIRVATLNFYIDPTHQKPIPPVFLEYLYKFSGFNHVFMLRINSNLYSDDLSLLNNVGVKEILSGVGLDYAMIGIKQGSSHIISLFSKKYRQGPSFEQLVDMFDSEYLNTKNKLIDAQERLQQAEIKIEHIEFFISKLKKLFAIPIKILKALIKIRCYLLNKILYFSKQNIKFIEDLANKNPKIKKILKTTLNKFPSVRAKIFKFKSSLQTRNDIYISKNSGFMKTIFKQKHSEEYNENLKFKELKYLKKFNEIYVIGSISGHYSLAAINRNIVFNIMDKIETSIVVYHEKYFDPIEPISLLENEFNTLKKINITSDQNIIDNKNRIGLYHHYPVIDKTKEIYGYSIAVFFWEESRIPQDTINILNTKYNGVVVSTWFIKKILIDNGCIKPIKVANIPLKELPSIGKEKVDTEKNEIRLLHISSALPRKGVDILLRAFNKICKISDKNFTLTIKTFPNPHNTTSEQVEILIDKKFQNRINIIFDENLTALDIANLYKNADIVVLPTRGEGLNMPAIEAAHYKKPVVTTNYSGQCEFMEEPTEFIDYKFEKAITHFFMPGSVWAEPSVDDLVEKILKISNRLNDSDLNIQLEKLQHLVDEQMFGKKCVDNFISSLSLLKEFNQKIETPKIAIISTYNTKCGIAEYSKYMQESLLNNGCNVNIYSWDDISYKNYINKDNLFGNLDINENIVWLQYHFSFYDINKRLKNDIKLLKDNDKIIVITLHSVRQILNHKKDEQLNWSETLNEFDRVFVHNINDLNALKAIGIIDNAVLIPHASQGDISKNNQNLSKLKIGFFGLLLPHKNLQELIKAFSKFLKNQQAELHLIASIVNEDSRREFLECSKLIKKLHIENHITWNTDFLPLNQVNNILTQCDVIIMPYLQSEEGASGAARIALSCCKNLIVSPSEIFDELREVSISTLGYDSEDILFSLKNYINNPIDKNRLEARKKWLQEHDWKNISKRYLSIFQSILMDKKFMSYIKEKE